MLQNRVNDPTMSNPGGIWVNPLRDVAHCFPYVIKGALMAMEQDLNEEQDPETNEMMCAYALALSAFVAGCTGPDAPTDIRELFRQSALLEQPDEAHKLFGKWLARAMLGLYFRGIKAAMHPGERALGVDDLLALTDMWKEEEDTHADK